MDPSSNFCNYRTALQGATQRSQMANSSREKIVIPVFNLFVKDIYFLHKIHTNHLPNGHINFKVSLVPCGSSTDGVGRDHVSSQVWQWLCGSICRFPKFCLRFGRAFRNETPGLLFVIEI